MIDETFQDDLHHQIRTLVDSSQFVLLYHGPSRISVWRRGLEGKLLLLILRLGRERITGLYSPRDNAEDAIPVLAKLKALHIPFSDKANAALNAWKKGRTLATPDFDQTDAPVGMDTTATLRQMRLKTERKPR